MNGSTWLAAHLYFDGGIYGEEADRVLLEVVAPLAATCRDAGWVERFFFVRYSEGGAHVRFRLQGAEPVLTAHVRPLVEARAAASRPIRDLAWVPYEPEVERYGGPAGLVLAERLFHHQSETALALVATFPGKGRAARLGKALLAMLALFHTFEGERQACARLAATYGRNYLRTLVPDAKEQKVWLEAFEASYNRQADQLAPYVDLAWDTLAAGRNLTEVFGEHQARLREVHAAFGDLLKRGELLWDGTVLGRRDAAVGVIVPSYVHMMSNRIGVTIQEESYLSVLISRTLTEEDDVSSEEDDPPPHPDQEE